MEVLEVRPSRSRPEHGILKARYSALNQHGETVLAFLANHLLARRGELA